MTPADQQAERYWGLAVKLASYAHRYHSVPYDEALSDALYGLAQAIRRYDPSQGVKFTTFAYKTIQGEILHGVRSRNIHAQPTIRLEQTINPDDPDASNLHDLIPDRAATAHGDTHLRDLLKRTHPKTQTILTLVEAGYKQTEIASHLGVSQMDVSRTLHRARTQLHHLIAA